MTRAPWVTFVSTALPTLDVRGVELSMVAGDDPDKLELELSENGAVSVSIVIATGDGNLSFLDMYFDATPIGDGSTAGYDVVGREFKMERDDGTRWFRARDWNGDPNIETFALIAADDEDGDTIGTNAPGTYDVDTIILHGTEVGSYRLYFENQYTADGDPRPPVLRDRGGIERPWIWGETMWFRNGWRDDVEAFDELFGIFVVPEPAAVVFRTLPVVRLLARRGCAHSGR